MNISRVLVTGGAGYIGAHVINVLIKQKYKVIVFDNLSTGKRKHLPKNVILVRKSILNNKAVKQTFEQYKPQAIIHLAALKSAGESMQDAIPYSDTNIIGTINILRAMIEYKTPNIIFSSTAAVYGEPQYLPIDEEHTKNPINYYGATKLIIENIIHWYSQIYGINYVILRYFNAAGHMPSSKINIIEPNPQNLIPIVLEVAQRKRKKLQIFGNGYPTPDGTCLRDYIHVSDLAKAHFLSLKYLNAKNKSITINLGTGRSYSVLEIYNIACQITQRNIPMEIIEKRHGDSASLYAKSILALKTLNWVPQYNNISEIIQHAWDSYLRIEKIKSK